MSNPAEGAVDAVKDTTTGLAALVKRHPIGALVVFGFIVLVVLRYRNTIVSAFARIPVAGPRAAAFAAGAAPTSAPQQIAA